MLPWCLCVGVLLVMTKPQAWMTIGLSQIMMCCLLRQGFLLDGRACFPRVCKSEFLAFSICTVCYDRSSCGAACSADLRWCAFGSKFLVPESFAMQLWWDEICINPKGLKQSFIKACACVRLELPILNPTRLVANGYVSWMHLLLRCVWQDVPHHIVS